MRTFFVTGGAGFIGSQFVRTLLAKHESVRVINFDALTYAGSLENLKDLKRSGSEPGNQHIVLSKGIFETQTK